VKRLFEYENGLETWLPEGLQLEQDIQNVMKPIITNFVKQGYSTRDIQLVITMAAFDVGLSVVLGYMDEN
jgi:hypothetical protein